MSEVCQLCKGAFSDDAVACPGGGWACKACVVKALILLKRIEAGESVEIRKRDWGFPEFFSNRQRTWCFYSPGGRYFGHYDSLSEAAAAWNAQYQDAEKERGGE